MRIRETTTFAEWLRKLKDGMGKRRILLALERCRLQGQMLGDIKSVGQGVHEMRFHFGPGYRVYYAQKGNMIVILLAG